MKQSGFVLPSFGMQLMIGAAILAATNLFTAIKVADYVQDKNDLQNLNAKVAVIEREKVIEVLDKKTLEAALAQQKKRYEQELQNERTINDILAKHKTTPDVPWCELDADELRVWNDQNKGLVGISQPDPVERGAELPGVPPTR
jgi:hypothetical protein